MNSLVVTAAVGAALALAISLVSRSGVGFLAGLLPLFPTFALFAHVQAFANGGSFQVKQVALFGLLSLIPYAGYLLSLCVLVERVQLRAAFAASIGLWVLLAMGAIVLWDVTIAPRLVEDA